jgi:hypothetical protein
LCAFGCVCCAIGVHNAQTLASSSRNHYLVDQVRVGDDENSERYYVHNGQIHPQVNNLVE